MPTIVRAVLVPAILFGSAALARAGCGDDPADLTAVAAARAQVAIACDCAGASNHRAYVACSARVVREHVRGGTLPKRCKRLVASCAARSTCGKPGFVSCCIPKGGSTACKLAKSTARCAAKGGTVTICPSCCDACTDAGCETASTTTTTSPVGATTTVPSATTTTAPVATTTTIVSPTTHTIQVGPSPSGFGFNPQSLTINVGETVRWVWGSSGHNVVSGVSCTPNNLFCSPNDTSCATAPTLPSGTMYEHVFGAAGSFPYFCAPHCADGMTGTITVVE